MAMVDGDVWEQNAIDAVTLLDPPAAPPEESVTLLALVFLVLFFLSSLSAASTSSFSFSTSLISVSHLLASSCTQYDG